MNSLNLDFFFKQKLRKGFPCSSIGKESAINAGDLGSVPGLGRSPGEGNGFFSSCLENPMDRGVHGVTRVGHYLAISHHHKESFNSI